MTSTLEGGTGHGKADEGNRGCVNVTVTGGGGKMCGRHIRKDPSYFVICPEVAGPLRK